MYFYSFFSRHKSLITSTPDNVGDDCPVFDGLFEYCSISAGGSMGRLAYLPPSTLARLEGDF
jgi:hypothetical protein